jgi:hypothetical protein
MGGLGVKKIMFTVGGVDPEVDGQVADALVGPGDAISLVLDLLADAVKVHELLPLTVQKLPILCKNKT